MYRESRVPQVSGRALGRQEIIVSKTQIIESVNASSRLLVLAKVRGREGPRGERRERELPGFKGKDRLASRR